MKDHKPLIRRTFLQERFIILMELQQKGIASFDELTELDGLINHDPKLRDIILEEMEETDTPLNPDDTAITRMHEIKQPTLWEKLTTLMGNWFHFEKTSGTIYPTFQ